jgi:hypothetical protein
MVGDSVSAQVHTRAEQRSSSFLIFSEETEDLKDFSLFLSQSFLEHFGTPLSLSHALFVSGFLEAFEAYFSALLSGFSKDLRFSDFPFFFDRWNVAKLLTTLELCIENSGEVAKLCFSWYIILVTFSELLSTVFGASFECLFTILFSEMKE